MLIFLAYGELLRKRLINKAYKLVLLDCYVSFKSLRLRMLKR